MKIAPLLLAALMTLPAQAVTLAPAVETHTTAAVEYATAPFDRAARQLPPRYEGHDGMGFYARVASLQPGETPAAPLTAGVSTQARTGEEFCTKTADSLLCKRGAGGDFSGGDKGNTVEIPPNPPFAKGGMAADTPTASPVGTSVDTDALLGGLFAFSVDLNAVPGNPVLGYDGKRGVLDIRYVMTGNHVTEGWNWTPLADPKTTDYYRYKFLPLKDVTVEKTPSDVWKYEYMLTFANLYDFYPRSSDDNAGFAARIALPQAEALALLQGNLRMLAVGRLAAPWHSQSSTFWKATDTAPYDYMLKKRYVVADLLEVWFYDYASGKVLAKLQARTP